MSLARSGGDSLDLSSLTARFASREVAIASVMDVVQDRIANCSDRSIWISVLSAQDIAAQVRHVQDRCARGERLQLLGVSFAVKDNIDVAGYPTTAACPDFAYVPEKSATVVTRLQDAGAILVGKTNLDQFATGLVGVRSPYGACRNPFDGRYIAGGSSSGSAVAVAAGLVSFALGTDTAGSGRVPAAFNNIVGYKPTRGLISTAGVVPACRSLDCVSIFALTCADAQRVLDVAQGYDASIYSRRRNEMPRRYLRAAFNFGVPHEEDLRFFGNESVEAAYRQSLIRLEELGGKPVEIDYTPFASAARLLYQGPWLAERLGPLKDFLAKRPEAFLDVTRQIISGGARFDGASVFAGMYELEAHCQAARERWRKMDVLAIPTAGTIYTIEQIKSDPVALNSNLGYYTNFVNLMDLCGVSVPAAIGEDGLPVGLSLIGPAGMDEALLALGDRLHRSAGLPLGATGCVMPSPSAQSEPSEPGVQLAVVGAHLSGQPLNHQLRDLNARLVRTCRTSSSYRLYALPGTTPPKPGLIRAEEGSGEAIEVEVWAMSAEAFGSFVAAIPPPLGIGTIRLEDGSGVKGFLCESYATAGGRDISSFGGWRKFLAGV